MPYKSEKIKLNEKQDRRRKLSSEDIEAIKKKYATGMYSWQSLANEYKCSKSRIGTIVNIERGEKVKQRIKENWRKYQADREQHNKDMRKYRKYKQELYLKGELKVSED